MADCQSVQGTGRFNESTGDGYFYDNPQAFSEENINLLRSGAVLSIPATGSVQNLNAELAVQDSLDQVQSYREEVLASSADSSALTGLPSETEVKSPYQNQG